jgi:tetratricopeptide (TPR) repeat protein
VAVAIATLVVFFNLRLIDARDQALSSEARMQRIYRLMLNLFEGDDSAASPAEGLRVVNLLDRGAREVEGLGAEPDLQAELSYTFGGLYHKLGRIDRAGPMLESALALERALSGPGDPQTIRPQLALASLRIDQSRIAEADTLARQALALARRRYAADSVEVAKCTAMVGKVLVAQGKYEEARPILEESVTVLSRDRASVELSEALGDLAAAHYYFGQLDASEEVNRKGLLLDQELFGERHPNVAAGLFNMGNYRLDRGDYVEAERLYSQGLQINEDWYGPAHPRTASNLLMVGRALVYQGRLSEASAYYDRALVAMRTLYGERHVRFASVLSLMGDLARDRNQPDEAERLFQRAAAIFREASGDEHEFYLHQLSNLGSVRLARGQFGEAEQLLRQAVERLTAVVPKQLYTGIAEVRLAAALSGQKRYLDAERHARAGYTILGKVTGPSSAELQQARTVLAGIYSALNEPSKAKELVEPARSR